MTEHTTSISALLDLAASTDDELVRAHAIGRVAALTVSPPSPSHDSLRGMSVAVERFLERLRLGGVPAPRRALTFEAVALGRTLIDLDTATLGLVATDLGVVQAVVLVRSFERDSAADLIRSLDHEQARLATLSTLAPDLSTNGIDAVIRRFAALSPLGFSGAALTRALGRSLVASLLSEAEPDVVAAIGLRLPLSGPSAEPEDFAWFATVDRVIDRHRTI